MTVCWFSAIDQMGKGGEIGYFFFFYSSKVVIKTAVWLCKCYLTIPSQFSILFLIYQVCKKKKEYMCLRGNDCIYM